MRTVAVRAASGQRPDGDTEACRMVATKVRRTSWGVKRWAGTLPRGGVKNRQGDGGLIPCIAGESLAHVSSTIPQIESD